MRVPSLYRYLDQISGIGLLFVTLFLAWAFGVNGLPWALWTVRSLGWLLGAVWLAKLWVRRGADWRPIHEGQTPSRGSVYFLGAIHGGLLLWVLISWLNPRADATFTGNQWDYGITVLKYFDSYIPWLPHSYDRTATRGAFWTYSALIFIFWAARDWFLAETLLSGHPRDSYRSTGLPFRVRLWLWTLILSAVFMGVVGILQKLDGTRHLLWILPWGKPTVPELPFGPYMYRTNAAQYFNLIWPVALGFWWQLRREVLSTGPRAPIGGDASFVLLPVTAVLMACPAVTLSRGGTLVAGAMVLASGLLFGWLTRRRRGGSQWVIGVVLLVAASLAVWVAGRDLLERFRREDYQSLNGRTKIYAVASRMLDDFGLLGSGAETIPAIYYLYRETAADSEAGEGYLHHDWMETLVTFGWLGSGFVFLMPLAGIWMWRAGRGHRVSAVFCGQLILSLVGMMAHAFFDFPFQITSLLGTWVLLAALLSATRISASS